MTGGILGSKGEVRAAVAAARARGARVALVPTMGALHDGHLSLVEAARTQADYVVVSIFVNPTQFGPSEDFERYPRDIERDSESLGPLGVDAIFAPPTEEMYPPGAETSVVPGRLAERWEGAIRPGHFAGVATIVTKLLNIVRPDVAMFGEKDYQQLQVIRALVDDLDVPVEIVGCPIVRDPDGLAMSSRNAYLTEQDRAIALGIPAALAVGREMYEGGSRDGRAISAAIAQVARDAGVALDYAEVVDPRTLAPIDVVSAGSRAIIAGRVGSTRLLDNGALGASNDVTETA